MKNELGSWWGSTRLGVAFGIGGAAALVCACSAEPAEGAGGGAGVSGSGGSPGAGAAGGGNVRIVPDPTGWVEGVDNELGIQGAWYPYGDQYGVAKCTNVGLHKPEEC